MANDGVSRNSPVRSVPTTAPAAPPPPAAPIAPLAQPTQDSSFSAASRTPGAMTALPPPPRTTTPAAGEAYARLTPELKSAVDAFRKSGYPAPDAAKALIAAGRAGNADVTSALGDLIAGSSKTGGDFWGAARSLEMLKEIGTPAAADQVARAAAHPDYSNVAAPAIDVLRQLGHNGTEAALKSWDGAPDEVRRNLLPVLLTKESLREPRAQAVAIAATQSPNALLSQAASDGLVEALTGSFRDPELTSNPAFRRTAANAIAQAGVSNPSAEGRQRAAYALHKMVRQEPANAANPEAVSILAQSKDPRTALTAAEIYADTGLMDSINKDPKLQRQALSDLKTVAEGQDFNKNRAYRAMGRIETREARQLLVGLAESKEPGVRAAAMMGLQQAGDPSVTDLILQKAVSDPSPEVRMAAMDAVRSLTSFGSEADQVANFQKVQDAIKGLSGPVKADFEHAARKLKDKIAGSANRYDALTQSMAKDDPVALADALSKASSGDLKLFEADLKRAGKTLGGVLGELRTSNPKGHEAVVDAFTQQISGKYVYANVSEASTKSYLDALQADLKSLPDAELRAFAERNLKVPSSAWGDKSRVAAELLGAMGDDRTVKALVDFGPSAAGASRTVVLDQIKARPSEQLDRVALPVVKQEGGPSASKDFAAAALARNGTPASKIAAGEYFAVRLEAKGAALKEQLDGSKAWMANVSKDLNNVYQLRELTHQKPGLLSPEQNARMHRDIANCEKLLRDAGATHEAMAAESTAFLSDPDVKLALANLPEERLMQVMETATEGLAGTAAGRAYVEHSLIPALKNPEKDPLYKVVFKGTDKVRNGALTVINKFAPELALQGEKTYQLAMQRAVGLKDVGQVGKMEQALIQLAEAGADVKKGEEAKKALESLGIRGGYNQLNGAFSLMNFTLGVRDLVKNPELRNIVSTAKDAADLTEKLSLLAEKSPKLSAAGKLVGKAAFPLTAVLGFIDLNADAKRGDMAATGFDALTAAGGIVATAGLVLDATVVGAVAGIPLTVIGGVMATVGTVGKWIFGDSDAEKFARKLGYI
jgi:hypothetical protein